MQCHVLAFAVLIGCASAASGQTATFEQLRTPFYPFAAFTNESKMSGDGQTVTDGTWRWNAKTGYSPSGFIPGETPGSTLRRRPLGLSDDGSVEFGELRREDVLWPSEPLQGYYWQGGGPFLRLNTTFGAVAPWDAFRNPLSGDGNWVVYTKSLPGQACRRNRSGDVENLGVVGGYWAAPVSRDGNVVIVQGQAAAIPPIGTAADASWVDLGPSSQVIGMSGNAAYFFGYALPAYRQWVVWGRSGAVIAKLGPVGGGNWLTLRGVSDDGTVASGVSWSGSTSPVYSPIVWRSGELPRRLDVVLRRFNADNASYFNLTDVLSMSSDGRTILGYATSPWFGASAFVATIPDWEPCAADFDFDGVVGDEDFVLFASAYNKLDTTECDLNTDNLTDDGDFVLFAAAYDQLICP